MMADEDSIGARVHRRHDVANDGGDNGRGQETHDEPSNEAIGGLDVGASGSTAEQTNQAISAALNLITQQLATLTGTFQQLLNQQTGMSSSDSRISPSRQGAQGSHSRLMSSGGQGSIPQGMGCRDIVKPSTFDGSTPWDDYWTQFQTIAEANQWSLSTTGVKLMASLRGIALAAVCNIQTAERNLAAMVQCLNQRFGAEGQTRLYLARLRQRVQGPKEDVATFAADVESLARRAVSGGEARETIAMEQFLNGLRNQRVREMVIGSDPETLRLAVTRDLCIEAGLTTPLLTIRTVEGPEPPELYTKERSWEKLKQ